MICYEMLLNTKMLPDFSPPKNVKDYERFSFVTGEKQETQMYGGFPTSGKFFRSDWWWGEKDPANRKAKWQEEI